MVAVCASLAVSNPLRVSAQGDEASGDELEVEDEGEDEDDEDDDFFDEDEEAPEAQTGILGPHAAVTTYIHFPDYKEHKFVQGEDVVVLVGVANGSPSTYFNVSYIGAQLHSPFDFSYYIQNFTVRETESIVGPSQETTIEYRFRPDVSLEPIEFQLSVWALYNSSEGRMYQSTVFNDTIELLERSEPWSVSSVFNTALVLSGLGVIGYVAYSLMQGGQQSGKKKRARRTDSDAPKQPVEWETKVYQPAVKQRTVRKSNSKKGSKKSDSKKADSATEQ